MTSIISNESAKSARFSWIAGFAGLLVGLAIVYYWRDFARWWEINAFKAGRSYAMSWGQLDWQMVSPLAFFQLGIVGFLSTLMLPGHGKLPIIACLLHNQPPIKPFFSWIMRGWVLKCGVLVIVFSNVLFLKYVSISALNLYISIISCVGYLCSIIMALLLIRDAWHLAHSPTASQKDLHIPLVLILGFQLPGYAVLALQNAIEHEHMLLGLSMAAAIMVGVLLAYLVIAGMAVVVRKTLGDEIFRVRRGQFALFNGMVILCVTGKIIFIFVSRLLE